MELLHKKPFEPLAELSNSVLNQPSLFHLAKQHNGEASWDAVFEDGVESPERLKDGLVGKIPLEAAKSIAKLASFDIIAAQYETSPLRKGLSGTPDGGLTTPKTSRIIDDKGMIVTLKTPNFCLS